MHDTKYCCLKVQIIAGLDLVVGLGPRACSRSVWDRVHEEPLLSAFLSLCDEHLWQDAFEQK